MALAKPTDAPSITYRHDAVHTSYTHGTPCSTSLPNIDAQQCWKRAHTEAFWRNDARIRSDNTSRVQESEGINCCTYHLCLQKQLRPHGRVSAACHVRGTRTRVHTNKGAQAVKLLCTRIRVRTNKCAQAVGLLCTRRVHQDKSAQGHREIAAIIKVCIVLCYSSYSLKSNLIVLVP